MDSVHSECAVGLASVQLLFVVLAQCNVQAINCKFKLSQNKVPSLVNGKQACGSGGTAAGLALGLHLSGLGCKLHAMGVCDDPDYFYNYMGGLLEGMGATKDTIGHPPC